MAYIEFDESIFENPVMLKKLTKSEKHELSDVFNHAFDKYKEHKNWIVDDAKENLKSSRDIDDKDTYAKEITEQIDTFLGDENNRYIVEKCIEREDTLNDITYCIVEELEKKKGKDVSFAVGGIVNTAGEIMLEKIRIYNSIVV